VVQAGALPLFWELVAPSAWRSIDFISDLHLSSSTPATSAALQSHLRHTTADAVFLLGDVFEVWVGDDSRADAFEAEITAMLADAAAQRCVGFMVGNRDFLVGSAFMQSAGLLALPDPTVLVAFGERILLSHGDALCLDDHDYQAFRTVVRSTAWQADFLGKPLEERRAIAAQMRQASQRRQAEQREAHSERDSPFADVDTAAAVQWMHEAQAPTLIHGHTHRPARHELAPGYCRYVLSDWDCDGGQRAEVLRLSQGGLRRVAPAAFATEVARR